MKPTTKLTSIATTIIIFAISVLFLAPSATATVPTASKAMCKVSGNATIMNAAFHRLVNSDKASPATCEIYTKSKNGTSKGNNNTGKIIVLGF